MDPTDLRGVPMIIEGEAKWVKPSFLPKEENTIIFFDELNHAPPSVQSAAYQIILDGRIGEHRLPNNTIRIAAGNQKGEGILGYDLPLPLKNRFVHLEMRHDKNAWVEWARDSAIDTRIISFIESKPELLMELPKGQATQSAYGFPTPRSWVFTSKIIKGLSLKEEEKILAPLVEGAIGKKASAIFNAYLLLLEEYKTPEFILDNPDYITKDVDKSVMWSVLTSVAEIVTEDKKDNFLRLIDNPSIPKELSQYALSLALSTYCKTWLLSGDILKKALNSEEVKLAANSL
jgi:hypothetical protein